MIITSLIPCTLAWWLCYVLNCWDGVRSTASPPQPHPHLWTTAPCDHNWFLASLLACARFCLPSLSPPCVTFPSQFGEVFFSKQTNAIELKFPQASFAILWQTFSNKVQFLCYLLQSSSTGNCFRFYLIVKMWSTSPPPSAHSFSTAGSFCQACYCAQLSPCF